MPIKHTLVLLLSIVLSAAAQLYSAQHCPKALTPYCACSLDDFRWRVTCSGSDVANVTQHLPPNTTEFRYTAREIFVNLANMDLSKLQDLRVLQIRDPGDYEILNRKIAPIAKDSQLFSALPKLEALHININWPMPKLPNLLSGLNELRILDFSNTRWVDIDNLIMSLQGLRNNTKMKVLSLWNLKTFQHSSTNLDLDLAKLLEPLSGSRLEELNIGYNALRSVGPGLIQYAPWLKRLIVRNNVLIPLISCSLMTEVVLHKHIIEADFSGQGYRPASDLPNKIANKLPSFFEDPTVISRHLEVENKTEFQTIRGLNQSLLSHMRGLSSTVFEKLQEPSQPLQSYVKDTSSTEFQRIQRPSQSLQTFTGVLPSRSQFLSLDSFLSVVQQAPVDPGDSPGRDVHGLNSSSHDLPPSVLKILKHYLTCFIMLYNDTCNIFRPECSQVKELLVEDHSLFCALLNLFFMWHFAGVHCDYIPPFNEIISPNCGACLVMPTLGNLRKLDLSNLNIYDLVIQYDSYRNRPNCFHPNTSVEYIDFTASAIHGYTEVDRYFASETTGLENLKVFNCSGNALTVLYPAIGLNFPQLQVLNASNNHITMRDNQTFANIIAAVQVLDLSHNNIGEIGQDKFAQLKHLRQLDLSYNLIKLFNMSLASSQLLEYLDLSNNLLNSLPQFTIEGLNQIALANASKQVHVDLTGNSLICTCASKNFVEWVLESHPPNLVFVRPGTYSCTNRYSYHVAMGSVTISALIWECYENVFYGLIGAASGVFLMLLALGYRRRFFLRHKWYTLTKTVTRGAYDQQQYTYDALFCYDGEDDEWIENEAKRRLKKFRVAYSEEDIHPGQNVHEGLEELIRKSKRCVVVLSPAFVMSAQKMRQAHDIDEHLTNTGAEIVIVIQLRPLPSVGLDQTLTQLRNRRLCLIWREDNIDDQAYFWEKITDVLEKPCKELYDVQNHGHANSPHQSPNHDVSAPRSASPNIGGIGSRSLANASPNLPNAYRTSVNDDLNAQDFPSYADTDPLV